MDQRRGLERLARLFLGHLLGRQPAQLVVDQRQELLGGVGLSLLNGAQDTGDLAHEAQDNLCSADPQEGERTRGRVVRQAERTASVSIACLATMARVPQTSEAYKRYLKKFEDQETE